jgi:hypothetical protein
MHIGGRAQRRIGAYCQAVATLASPSIVVAQVPPELSASTLIRPT